ncbi:MAG: hypothetical protein O7H41_14935 [Planctomycetota bacterium]|nr:hypothetical protein [Planctomycetota bacterium]
MTTATKKAPAKPYRRAMPGDWWLKNPRYFFFMIRELTSVFVALFVILHLIYLMMMATKGAAGQAQALISSPFMINLHVVILVFALIHSISWLALVGRLQVVQLGEKVVPPRWVTAGAFAGWFVVSAAVALFLTMGSG